MQHFLQDGYLGLVLVTALSGSKVPIGSELVTACAGALASGWVTGGHPHFSAVAAIVVAIASKAVGSIFGYELGRFGGRPLVVGRCATSWSRIETSTEPRPFSSAAASPLC